MSAAYIMIYTLERKIQLGASVEQCWDFLRNPANLNIITPPDLQFKIITNVPEEMYNGLLIEYSIRIPGFGRQKWLTEIKHIRIKHSFIDEQQSGPFRFWNHYHQLTEIAGGVVSLDRVTYIMPYGFIGTMLHSAFIRKTLDRIFNYREQRLAQLFPYLY